MAHVGGVHMGGGASALALAALVLLLYLWYSRMTFVLELGWAAMHCDLVIASVFCWVVTCRLQGMPYDARIRFAGAGLTSPRVRFKDPI